MKTLPLGVELFHAYGETDRQTDRRDETNIRFSILRMRLTVNI